MSWWRDHIYISHSAAIPSVIRETQRLWEHDGGRDEFLLAPLFQTLLHSLLMTKSLLPLCVLTTDSLWCPLQAAARLVSHL